MKIGILSMQRIKNYGSFLQAYGLKKIIESIGNEVEFVDYRIEKCINKSEKIQSNHNELITKIKHILQTVVSKEKLKARKMYKQSHKFDKMIEQVEYNELKLTKQYNYSPKVDVLVIGSDEVFNCTQNNENVGYSKELFGYNNNANKLLSYAASFGSTNMEKIDKYELGSELSTLLSEFSAISVRDENSAQIIRNLVKVEPTYSLDPVLIYDFKKEITNSAVKIKDYILVYAYSERINKEEQLEIKKFAKKHNKKIVSIGTVQPFCDIYIPDASPFELLEYVKKADYIVTDTFHGTIYSIKYNKKFATIIRNMNSNKLNDLLQRCYMEERKVVNIKELENILLKPIDYIKTNEMIQKEKQKTIQYLKSVL